MGYDDRIINAALKLADTIDDWDKGTPMIFDTVRIALAVYRNEKAKLSIGHRDAVRFANIQNLCDGKPLAPDGGCSTSCELNHQHAPGELGWRES